MPNNGIVHGSPTFSASAANFGQCINFDGSTTYIDIGNAWQPPTGSSWAVRLKVQTSSTGANQVIIGSPTAGWIGLNSGLPKVNINISGNTQLSLQSSGTSISDNNWHELELNYDNTAQMAYLLCDGTIVASGSANYTQASSGSQFSAFIGCYNNGGNPSNFFLGAVDELSIWSALQHNSNYTPSTTPAANTSTNLVNICHFDGDVNDSAGTVTTLLTPIASNFWDNGYTAIVNGVIQTSPLARLVVPISATGNVNLSIQAFTDIYSFNSAMSAIGLRFINLSKIVTQISLNCTAQGLNTLTASIQILGGTVLEIINGPQQRVTNSTGWWGTYVKSVNIVSAANTSFANSVSNHKLLIYGTSIEVGGPNTNAPFAWTDQLRLIYPGNIQVEAYGARQLYHDCSTPAAITAFASFIASQNPEKFQSFIGINDWIMGSWVSTAFAGAYGSLLDQIHALAPLMQIEIETPLIKSDESANANGETLSIFRAAIFSLLGGRPFLTIIDGSRVLTAADLGPDGLHPTISGAAKLTLYRLGTANALSPRIVNFDPNAIVSAIMNAIPPTLTGPAITFGQQINQLWRRFFKPSALTVGTLTTYADDGATALTSQTISDDGITQRVGSA